jgi:hypothetical protein
LIPIPLYPVRPVGLGSGLFHFLREQHKILSAPLADFPLREKSTTKIGPYHGTPLHFHWQSGFFFIFRSVFEVRLPLFTVENPARQIATTDSLLDG